MEKFAHYYDDYKKDNCMKNRKETYQICAASWIAIVVGVVALLLMKLFHIDIEQLPIRRMSCLLYTLFHVYCPGCGGTRAVFALLRGDVLLSLYYHPVVVYTVVMYAWYLISNTVQWLSKEKIRIGTNFKTWYGVVAIVIIVVNWVVRNVLLFVWEITI